MDELGSALRHSDEPNFRVAPFLFMPEGNLASAVRFPSHSFSSAACWSSLILFLLFFFTVFSSFIVR